MIFDILSLIPGSRKKTESGWYSFDAVCCHHKGHRRDDRRRGGIIFENETNWTYHCFNCGFSSNFILGKSITAKTRDLLGWLGIDTSQINRWSLESLKKKDLIEHTLKKRYKLKTSFKELPVPENFVPLDENDARHKHYIDYITSRGLTAKDYPFLVSPDDEGRANNRVIIPYTFNNKYVGNISRYLDGRFPKYIKEQPSGFVFGYDLQKKDYEVCLVFEGIFDAIPLNGCALLHDDISDEQAEILRSLNRRIVIIPDQDKTGLKIIDKALDFGFAVALPNWGDNIKDANDAVLKYGRIPTLLSILQCATHNKVKLELQRKSIVKRL